LRSVASCNIAEHIAQNTLYEPSIALCFDIEDALFDVRCPLL